MDAKIEHAQNCWDGPAEACPRCRLVEAAQPLLEALEIAIGELTNVDASLQERQEAAAPGIAAIKLAKP